MKPAAPPTVPPRLRLLAAATALLLASCLHSGPVGVREVTPEESEAVVSACVVDGTGLSTTTRDLLRFYDLQTRYAEDALDAVRALHAHAVQEKARGTFFALSELCYAHGLEHRDRDAFLASAVYAYLYLLGTDDPVPPNPYDRRFRWSCEIYNGALRRAFESGDATRFEPESGRRTLPTGRVRVALDRDPFPRDAPGAYGDGGADRFRFLPADRFEPRGLALTLRDSGLGVPLIAIDSAPTASRDDSRLRVGIPELPATAFLRVTGSVADVERGIEATLELHSGFATSEVEVAGQHVPLEYDRSSFLAHALDRSEVWDFSIRGFFSSEHAARDNKLILVQPYEPGRVPVIFVHGTASSPGYWADLFNSLWGDPVLHDHAQFWFFKYATGNPIAYTAADLRDALDEAVRTLDPDGDDFALRDMVVIGHSQGGLLAKMMVVDGDLAWFEATMGQSIGDMGFSDAQTRLIRRGLEFEPVPWVRRVVFVSTPHHGSFIADKWYSEIIGGLVSLPKDILDLGLNIGHREKLPEGMRNAIPTSVDNMSSDNPFLLNLLASPIAPGVASHSIISIGDADPRDPEAVAKSDDGIVECASQHLDGVDSEALVPSGHSCQSHPATIQEVRRILREHARDAADRARWRGPADVLPALPPR